jgi:transcription antitermination factor NusG
LLRWYVINTYSGHENKVKANIERRIVTFGRQGSIRRIVVPTEQVVETNKDGRFIVCWDPLDGSSIVDNNWAVGTMIGAHRTIRFSACYFTFLRHPFCQCARRWLI